MGDVKKNLRDAQRALGRISISEMDEDDAEFVEETYGRLDTMIAKYR